jgi:transposase
MVTLGNTLESWLEEIVCMWRYSKNNSITEGFHRKMKLIQRRAYGFKNFENYRLRVRVLCCGKNFILK